MRRIYVTGAAGAGVTTLGAAVAEALRLRHVDVDAAYWLPTDPPFTAKRPPRERLALIAAALGNEGWVLTGAFDGWGEELVAAVDVVVFVDTPTPLRLARLRARERARYGARIAPGGDMHGLHRAFMGWAAAYDDPSFHGRNRRRHETWLARLAIPVLRLDGARPCAALTGEALRAATMAS